jgi:hypothetical protein
LRVVSLAVRNQSTRVGRFAIEGGLFKLRSSGKSCAYTDCAGDGEADTLGVTVAVTEAVTVAVPEGDTVGAGVTPIDDASIEGAAIDLFAV